MLKTPHERVVLLKAGINTSTIEKLYLEHNNLKLVRQPVLFDAFDRRLPGDLHSASQFEGVRAKTVFKKPEFILICFILLVAGINYPVSILFTLILGILIIPPLMAEGLLMIELFCMILKELELLSRRERGATIISLR